jgi:hypothetical protein
MSGNLETVAATEALPIAVRARAAGDRNRLGAMVARGSVRVRLDEYSAKHPDFVADINRRARAQAPREAPRVNLAIRPKKKRGGSRKRR